MSEPVYPKALNIAIVAHSTTKRDDGKEDYINHPLRVASQFEDDFTKSAAILHDVIEDTKWTKSSIVSAGIPIEVADVVEILSRKERENYYDFILRVKNSPMAIKIKIADIDDNLKNCKEGSRADKYRLARHILTYNVNQISKLWTCWPAGDDTVTVYQKDEIETIITPERVSRAQGELICRKHNEAIVY
jgi:(p)ppGpp synthase/HD superfamily hydrolase